MPKRSKEYSENEQPQSKKIRIAVFTDAENMYLIQNFATTFYNCDKKKERLAQLKVMEVTMERAGFNRSSVEIESRLNNMRQQFKVTSKEREAGMAIKWKFYEAMDRIMNSKPMDAPEPLIIKTNK